jgi:hypothetical protein
MSSITHFPQFSSLPTELRLKIWAFSFPPNIIDIWALFSPGTPPRLAWDAKSSSIRSVIGSYCGEVGVELCSKPRVPILGICHESREWAIENGIQGLNMDLFIGRAVLGESVLSMALKRHRFPIDPENDIPFFHIGNVTVAVWLGESEWWKYTRRVVESLGSEILEKLRSVAISTDLMAEMRREEGAEFLSMFRGLEKLFFVGKEGVMFEDFHTVKTEAKMREWIHLTKDTDQDWKVPRWYFVKCAKDLVDVLQLGETGKVQQFSIEDATQVEG